MRRSCSIPSNQSPSRLKNYSVGLDRLENPAQTADVNREGTGSAEDGVSERTPMETDNKPWYRKTHHPVNDGR